jgi:hypothetical protein
VLQSKLRGYVKRLFRHGLKKSPGDASESSGGEEGAEAVEADAKELARKAKRRKQHEHKYQALLGTLPAPMPGGATSLPPALPPPHFG